jgi:hypothetical protein
MAVYQAFSLGECYKYDVDNLLAVATDAKPVSWHALITCDVAFHVAVGSDPVASTGSLRVPANARAHFVVAVGAGERLSLLGIEVGSAWVVAVT